MKVCGWRAKAEMSAAKIWAMENEPRNLTIGTLIRVAHGLGSRVEELENRKWKFEIGRRLRSRRGADEMSREKSKHSASANTSGAQRRRFKPKAAVPAAVPGVWPLPPTNLHEYQNRRVTKFAF